MGKQHKPSFIEPEAPLPVKDYGSVTDAECMWHTHTYR